MAKAMVGDGAVESARGVGVRQVRSWHDRLPKCGAIPAPEMPRGVGEFDVNAGRVDGEVLVDVLADVVAEAAGLVGGEGADIFDFNVAAGGGAAPKGHGDAGGEGGHDVGFGFVELVGQGDG